MISPDKLREPRKPVTKPSGICLWLLLSVSFAEWNICLPNAGFMLPGAVHDIDISS